MSRVETRALPAPSQPATIPAQGTGAQASGGQGLGAYRPSQQLSSNTSSDVTGSVNTPVPAPTSAPVAPPPSARAQGWTWEGGTAITVGNGEDIEMIARKYGVPQTAIMQANNITDTAAVRPGRRLVIPRYVGTGAQQVAAAAPVSAPAAAPAASAPRAAATGFTHTVEPGQSLLGIAKRYHKPVAEVARANNIQPYAKLNAGDRIVIPGMQQQAAAAPVRTQTQPVAQPVATTQSVAAPQVSPPRTVAAEPTQSARVVTPAAQQPEAPATDATKSAEAVGAIPSFRWPARGRVIASYGSKQNGQQNDGINIAVPEGTPVKAAEDGTIAYAGNELKGFGNLVLIRHANGYVSAYAHASELLVKRGDTVKRGQIIGRSGQTGNVTSPQLHFEIRKGSTPVDPAQYLGNNG